MKRLDLRSRLLIAIVLVALLQVVTAAIVVSVTRTQLVDQVDDRLAVAGSPDRGADLDHHDDDAGPSLPPPADGDRGRAERLGDTYEGILSVDGDLITIFAPNSTGVDLPA
ncbi:MAG: hypothetical protein R2695_04575 [Acidimicrobiales bacterium]